MNSCFFSSKVSETLSTLRPIALDKSKVESAFRIYVLIIQNVGFVAGQENSQVTCPAGQEDLGIKQLGPGLGYKHMFSAHYLISCSS